MTLPLRQRLLAAAAFVTALGTGYVANLDEQAAAADAEQLLATPRSAGTPGIARGQHMAGPTGSREGAAGRAASLARGAWPEPGAEALRAWGQDRPEASARPAGAAGVSAGAPAATPAAARARASTPAPAATPVAADRLAAEPVLPAWRLIGRVDDAGTARALLATAQQLRVVAQGDTLDGRWRIVRIGTEAVELQALADGQLSRLAWEAR
jgi:hypothetical protein